MSDIIDKIDALVDEQLNAYDSRSGYDHNVNQERCWHCGREWHGLKITARMERMAAQVAYDEDYRYADDDSEVLCPGSSFIGPTRRPSVPQAHAFQLFGWSDLPFSLQEATAQAIRAALGLDVERSVGLFQQIPTTFAPEPEPDPRTPQERALPRPSPTPPMWAAPITRRHNRRVRHGR